MSFVFSSLLLSRLLHVITEHRFDYGRSSSRWSFERHVCCHAVHSVILCEARRLSSPADGRKMMGHLVRFPTCPPWRASAPWWSGVTLRGTRGVGADPLVPVSLGRLRRPHPHHRLPGCRSNQQSFRIDRICYITSSVVTPPHTCCPSCTLRSD